MHKIIAQKELITDYMNKVATSKQNAKQRQNNIKKGQIITMTIKQNYEWNRIIYRKKLFDVDCTRRFVSTKHRVVWLGGQYEIAVMDVGIFLSHNTTHKHRITCGFLLLLFKSFIISIARPSTRTGCQIYLHACNRTRLVVNSILHNDLLFFFYFQLMTIANVQMIHI